MDSTVIKNTIDVSLIFEKDTNGKQECTGMLTPIMQDTLTSASLQQVCLHIVPNTSELVLDFTVYLRFVNNRR